ncbi:MAG: sulfatase-like hydrolase/transferase [Planctomycetota bacterium]
MRTVSLALIPYLLVLPSLRAPVLAARSESGPNVILLLSDDQGWGDLGSRGHAVLQTPHLDGMARRGVCFERFYAAAPVCSPTRGSVLTGRHPGRYGIDGANVGHLPAEESTLAELLAARGYATGHFGKWHLGTLTRDQRDSNRGGMQQHAAHYAPPWEHGFERCFSTEAKLPTYDPMLEPGTGEPYGTAYWNERGERVTSNLSGDDSRVIMDRVLPFVRGAVEDGRPFLAVVWFHAPHKPVVAGPVDLASYADEPDPDRQRYYACLTALDREVGRLLDSLQDLGVARDTLVWFASDNGPEGAAGRGPGSTGGLRGRKRSLYEGGIRVPGMLLWPARFAQPRVITEPCTTLDILPTVAAAVGFELPRGRVLDGVDLLPLLEGRAHEPLPPRIFESGERAAVILGDEKGVSSDGGVTWEVYDLASDPAERRDLAAQRPASAARMRGLFASWRAVRDRSRQGADYGR